MQLDTTWPDLLVVACAGGRGRSSRCAGYEAAVREAEVYGEQVGSDGQGVGLHGVGANRSWSHKEGNSWDDACARKEMGSRRMACWRGRWPCKLAREKRVVRGAEPLLGLNKLWALGPQNR